jgi:hypothetical protein
MLGVQSSGVLKLLYLLGGAENGVVDKTCFMAR